MKKFLLSLCVITLLSTASLTVACGHEHEYTSVVTPPTCTEQGYTTHTCECGDTYTSDTVNALGHDFVNYVSNNNATCTEDGTKTAVCNRDGCEETDTITDTGSALDHDFTNYIADNNANYDTDGTKTATCNRDGCNETDTITDTGSMLESKIAFKTLTMQNKVANIKVPNATNTFAFNNEIEKIGKADFIVSLDELCEETLSTDEVSLTAGDNTFYIFEVIKGEKVGYYTISIYRKNVYEVKFNTYGGTQVASQFIEEDNLVVMPSETVEKAGYTFNGWDFDFTTPITQGLTINANLTANSNTPYKVEYYYENIEDSEYALTNTVDDSGTTDTLASITPATLEGFKLNEDLSELSKNIDGDGKTTLKVYYARKTYKLSSSDGATVTNAGTYKYGSKAFVSTTTLNLGYEFDGWYSGEELLSNELTYTFTVEKDVVAKCTVDERLSMFYISSTPTTCNLVMLLDKEITEVVIPDYVTALSAVLFMGCDKLETVTMGKGITSIGTNAFYSCVSLKSIVIPSGVTVIEDSTFYACDSLTSVEIPSNVESIGKNAFAFCDSLSSVIISSGVERIGDSAFYECKNLATVSLPSSLLSIGEYAFADCDSLTEFVIPNSIANIGCEAFRCDSLTIYCELASKPSGWDDDWATCPVVWDYKNNEVANDGYIYKVINGVRYALNNGVATVAEQPSNIMMAIIPSTVTYQDNNYSVTSIKDDAFRGCEILASLEIPTSVESIGQNAFCGCKGLTIVEIPNSVTSIGDYAFWYCENLETVTIGNGIENLSNGVFSGCGKLLNVAIGTGVKNIGSNAFSQCASLESIIIPDNVGSIGDYAFLECYALSSVVIGNGVTSIGEGAFSTCASLESVALGNSVQIIGVGAFDNCIGLTNIVLPSSLTSIGDYAFMTCSALSSIVIGNGVTSVGTYAFYGCVNLTIYCEAESKPSGWDSDWNSDGCEVVWGYKENEN